MGTEVLYMEIVMKCGPFAVRGAQAAWRDAGGDDLECRQLASIEPDEDDQAFWLRMADEWERLANLPIRPKENASPRQNVELQ
jgi:hypothetical protein